MKSLAVVLFIAGVGALAIYLARRPTIADGRVMEADLLAQLREHGVTGMSCDKQIPIGRGGAVFTCVATLRTGETQTVEYRMDRTGSLAAELKADGPRIPLSSDPWGH